MSKSHWERYPSCPVTAKSLLTLRVKLFSMHIAIPQQHGSWVLWLGPFAVGVGAGDAFKPGLLWLGLASFAGFLSLQPLAIVTKVLSGRRSRAELSTALFWLLVYGMAATTGAAGLVLSGNASILWLLPAALAVLIWQLRLVARRGEHGQLGAEIVGSGVLAFAAPAAYWTDAGGMAATGWWLWLLCWLQSSGAIVYIYLRLEHRRLRALPAWGERWQLARRSTLCNTVSLFIAALLAALDLVPLAVLLPFGAMLGETIYGGFLHPGIRAKPTAIGIRQVCVAVVFSALLILAYRL